MLEKLRNSECGLWARQCNVPHKGLGRFFSFGHLFVTILSFFDVFGHFWPIPFCLPLIAAG